MSIDEQEFLSGLIFYEDSDFSKVRNKEGFRCSMCNNTGVIYTNESVTFCPRKKSINIYNSSLIPARFSKCRNTRFDNGNWEIRERSIQNALLVFAHNNKCLFKQFRDLLSDIKDIYVKNESEKEYVDFLCEYDVLVVDDLGTTRMSEWETSVLDNLIDKRYNSKKHTIFNSNLAFLNGKKYKQTESSKILDYKIGDRNISRIFEMCHVLELTGTDFRKKNLNLKK